MGVDVVIKDMAEVDRIRYGLRHYYKYLNLLLLLLLILRIVLLYCFYFDGADNVHHLNAYDECKSTYCCVCTIKEFNLNLLASF